MNPHLSSLRIWLSESLPKHHMEAKSTHLRVNI